MEDQLRILVIDDDDGIAAVLEANFELDGRFVVVGRGRDGSEAVPLVRELRPDVVLMDLHMPNVAGVEATRRVMAAEPSTCVIGFTGSNDERERQAAVNAGAIAVLSKPFDPVALLDAVKRHAERCADAA